MIALTSASRPQLVQSLTAKLAMILPSAMSVILGIGSSATPAMMILVDWGALTVIPQQSRAPNAVLAML